MKVFISYNHKDQPTALKIRDTLAASGIDTVIDVEKMKSGENIKQFILDCIRESDVTLSLVSANSLMSGWVNMETVTSGVAGDLNDRHFIPCKIDEAIFERAFIGQAMGKIDAELAEIKKGIDEATAGGWGMEHLQHERTRYLKLKTDLPNTIGMLKDSLCIDLTPEHFDAGMKKITGDLKAGQTEPVPAPAEAPASKALSAATLDALKADIAGILDESARQRKEGLSKRLTMMNDMVLKYEEELDIETDFKRRTRCEREIETCNKSIEKILTELKS